ncbi:MAG: (Fe-S)-binding protein [Pseudomonadota bacterium]
MAPFSGKKEKSAGQRKDLLYCAYCPKLCRFSCPVSQVTSSETLTPWGKQSLLFEVERKTIALSSDYSSVFFACLECHACRGWCEHGIDVPRSLREGRRQAFESRCAPVPVMSMSRNYSERETIVSGMLEEKFPRINTRGREKLFLMPGCVTVLRDLKSVESAVGIMKELTGENFGLLSRHCCGAPLLASGDSEQFRIAARQMAEDVREAGTIVVMDPGCAYTMTRLYEEINVRLNVRVLTFVEFVTPYMNHFRKKIKIPQPAFYHDPCRLGRDLGIYSEPRDLLMKIVEGGIRDGFFSREKSLCCGGGGALPVSMPQEADAIARNLASSFKKEKAASVVTACPTCKHMIAASSESLEVIDIIDLLSGSMEGKQ